MDPMDVENIAAYKFTRLTELSARRRRLKKLCQRAGLQGTILLASEGINLFVAGAATGIASLLRCLENDGEIGALSVKRSQTHYQPFNRMLVKIKQEIIAFGVETVAPAARPANKISAHDLKRWLDEEHSFVLLDTRNDYELKLGTFERAVPAGIDHFREFPRAAENFPTQWRTQPVVMFCTGGIRCEKAGPLLEQMGFEQVFQLDGGILKYFEEVGSDHYRGDCFVFDQRVAVDAALRETDAAQCYACQAILTAEEQASPLYEQGKSCPFCYRTPQEEVRQTIARRNRNLRSVCEPLPGSVPYDNRRPIHVPADCDGLPLAQFLPQIAPSLDAAAWGREIEEGRLRLEEAAAKANQVVRTGQRYEHVTIGVIEPAVNAQIEILHEDAALVVVHKPAPLPMHPCGRYHKNTLAHLLAPIYSPQRLRNAHRLDANTSGVVVFTRTRRMASRLQPQFARGEVRKTYLARVAGHPRDDHFVCRAAIAASPSAAGTRRLDQHGKNAETEFRVRDRDPAGTSLLEVRPLTGRTNQIRIHLWSLGLPILGDPTYRAEGIITSNQVLPVDAPPMCLHAWKIDLQHPASGDRVEYLAPPPAWAALPTTCEP
jgi:RluA family pseudouridine synthase